MAVAAVSVSAGTDSAAVADGFESKSVVEGSQMCIIIIQPEGYVFGDDAIVDFYDRNPHGFGVMWMNADGQLKGVRTVVKNEREAIAAYQKYAAGKSCVIHFRFATSGPVNNSMAHPFAVSKDLYVVHNGVLPGGSKHESDTSQFVREVLQPSLEDYRSLQDPDLSRELEKRVRGSVLVFMDKDGTVTKFGNKGVEYDGCWYSNTYAWTLPPELDPYAYGTTFDADETNELLDTLAKEHRTFLDYFDEGFDYLTYQLGVGDDEATALLEKVWDDVHSPHRAATHRMKNPAARNRAVRSTRIPRNAL